MVAVDTMVMGSVTWATVVGLDSMAMVPGTASMAMALVHILRRLCRGGDGNHLEVLVVGAPMAVVGQD
jgi:hypothetical protein